MNYSSFHAFFSYVFVGLIFAFILLAISIRLFKIENPKYRKELYILTLALPILAFIIFHIVLDKQCSMVIYPSNFYKLLDALCKIGILTGRYLIPFAFITLVFGILKNLLGRIYFAKMIKGVSSPGEHQVNRVEAIVRNRCTSWNMPIPRILFTPRQDIAAVVFGIFNPSIIINISLLAELTDAELDMLLTHEIVHIKERDIIIGRILGYFRDVMFFSFIATVFFEKYLLEREMHCDQKTAEAIGGKKAYAKTLLKVWSLLVEKKGKNPIPNIGFIDDKNQMELRIKKLIANGTKEGKGVDYNFLKVKFLFVITLGMFLWVIC